MNCRSKKSIIGTVGIAAAVMLLAGCGGNDIQSRSEDTEKDDSRKSRDSQGSRVSQDSLRSQGSRVSQSRRSDQTGRGSRHSSYRAENPVAGCRAGWMRAESWRSSLFK